MNMEKCSEQIYPAVPDWLMQILPIICIVVGSLTLLVTWYFYKDIWNTPGFHWYAWLQPALMVLAGLLSIGASVLFAVRRQAAWDLLTAAVCMVPAILVVRLTIAIILVLVNALGWVSVNAGSLLDGTLLAGLDLNPWTVARNAGIVILIVTAFGLLDWLDKARKAGNKP